MFPAQFGLCWVSLSIGREGALYMKRLVLPELVACLLIWPSVADAGFSVGCSERPVPSANGGRRPAVQRSMPFVPPALASARDGVTPVGPGPERRAWVDELYRRFPNVAGSDPGQPPRYAPTPGR